MAREWMKRFATLCFLVAPAAAHAALPPVPGIEGHLTATGKALSEEDKKRLDELLGQIQATCDVDLAIYVVPAEVDASLLPWGEQIFDTWHIGKDHQGGGALLVIAPERRKCELIQSKGHPPVTQETVELLTGPFKHRSQQEAFPRVLTLVIRRAERLLEAGSNHLETGLPLQRDPEGALRYAGGSLLTLIVAIYLWRTRRES